MAWDQFRWTGVTYEEARAGCYDGAARLADMDADGVDAEILFPPQRTVGHFLGDQDDDFVRAGDRRLQRVPVGGVLRARPDPPGGRRANCPPPAPTMPSPSCSTAVAHGFKTVVISELAVGPGAAG